MPLKELMNWAKLESAGAGVSEYSMSNCKCEFFGGSAMMPFTLKVLVPDWMALPTAFSSPKSFCASVWVSTTDRGSSRMPFAGPERTG